MSSVCAGDQAIPKNQTRLTHPLGGCLEPRIYSPLGSDQGVVDAKVPCGSTQWRTDLWRCSLCLCLGKIAQVSLPGCFVEIARHVGGNGIWICQFPENSPPSTSLNGQKINASLNRHRQHRWFFSKVNEADLTCEECKPKTCILRFFQSHIRF